MYAMSLDLIVIIFLVVCLLYAVRGAYFGLTKVFFRLSALAGAYACAYYYHQTLSLLLSQKFALDLPPWLLHCLAGSLCFLASFMALSVFLFLINRLISKLCPKVSHHLSAVIVSRLCAAAIAGAFGFLICSSGLACYLIISTSVPLPAIQSSPLNQGLINQSENLARIIQTALTERIESHQEIPSEPTKQLIKPPQNKVNSGIKKSNGSQSQSTELSPTNQALAQLDNDPKLQTALQLRLQTLMQTEGQLSNFIRQTIPLSHLNQEAVNSLLQEADAEKRIAEQFKYLLNDHDALISALQSLQNNKRSILAE